MPFTVTTTHRPATDSGYLLVKNPAHTQSFPLSFGKAHVFYPEATEERMHSRPCCSTSIPSSWFAARLGARDAGALRQRPAVCRVVVPERGDCAGAGSAMAGRNKDCPELAGRRSRSWRPSMRCPAAAGKGAPQAVRAADTVSTEYRRSMRAFRSGAKALITL
ncbi:MAG: hypothetical protein R3F14_37170 [Polyangiaceae bacterium]